MIHLVVPGLLGSFPRFARESTPPALPALERLFARADRLPGPESLPQALFPLFGMSAQGPFPTAAVSFHADTGGARDTRYLLHADPIHLKPDQDRLLAFDFHHQPLQPGEAEPFVEAFNVHFSADGLELLAPHPTRWYLAVENRPEIEFHPLSEIVGRNVDQFLPVGPDAGRWRAWMNEVQMLFHHLPENARREATGEFTLNGLWFSGGGTLPDGLAGGTVDPRAVSVDADTGSDMPLAAGLALLMRESGEDALRIVQAPGRAVLDGDREAWAEALQTLDLELARMMDSDVCLYPCDGSRLQWSPRMRRRWWRRRKPLGSAKAE